MIRLALRVRRSDAELVLADLLELAPSGVEEIELPASDGGEGMVEYAVYGAPGELPLLPDVQAAAGGALVEISTSEVADDWSERWKQFHQPVLIEARRQMPPVRAGGGGSGCCCDDRPACAGGTGWGGCPRTPRARGGRCLFVRPPWETPSDRADALEIVIDPAQAFGTGAHATTRMCLELLLELAATEDARDPVLDVGSGSGVLAIAAAEARVPPGAGARQRSRERARDSRQRGCQRASSWRPAALTYAASRCLGLLGMGIEGRAGSAQRRAHSRSRRT